MKWVARIADVESINRAFSYPRRDSVVSWALDECADVEFSFREEMFELLRLTTITTGLGTLGMSSFLKWGAASMMDTFVSLFSTAFYKHSIPDCNRLAITVLALTCSQSRIPDKHFHPIAPSSWGLKLKETAILRHKPNGSFQFAYKPNTSTALPNLWMHQMFSRIFHLHSILLNGP